MAMRNSTGRANYEPNSWGTGKGGPREDPEHGYKHHPQELSGQAIKLRPESFGDHYSQARQFYISQTDVEQGHMQDALAFELSKVERSDIRERVVAHLRNIDDELAESVADALGMDLPNAIEPFVEPNQSLAASDALSILKNGPDSFAGRTLGILVTDGAGADLVSKLQTRIEDVGGSCKIVAPTIAGVRLSDDGELEADEKVEGGPSVLFDAVAIVVSEKGAEKLAQTPEARDFVSGAVAHKKFIAFTDEAEKLFEAAGLDANTIKGCFTVSDADSLDSFFDQLKDLRAWDRDN